ncbi:hypothetical protein BFJ63_vAg19559, partial [Fusarium oxysporum f. sp. narcissi]
MLSFTTSFLCTLSWKIR